MSETRYIRNLRPNSVNLRVGGRLSSQSVAAPAAARLELQLSRRGSRADNAAISERDFKDVQIQQALRRGQVEEISEEAFMTLQTIIDDETGEEGRISEEEGKQRATVLAKNKEREGGDTLEVSTEQNARFVIPEFQPETLNYHKEIPVSRERRERARRLMSPRLQYRVEPKSTDEELGLATKKDASAPAKKQTSTRRARTPKT